MEFINQFKVEDEAQASALHQLSEIGIYDFWTEAVPGRSVDIRTSPEETEQLGVWLEQHGITWSVMIEDVGVLMEAEKVGFVSSWNISLLSPAGFIRQEK